MRSKLFFRIGSLFLLIALISYALPKFFLKGDITHLNASFEEQIAKQRAEDIDLFKNAFSTSIQEHAALLKGNLTAIWEMPIQLSPWQQAGTIVKYNPNLGFVQLTQNKGVTAGVSVDNAVLYRAESLTLIDNISLVLLSKNVNDVEMISSSPFLGIHLPGMTGLYFLYSTQLLDLPEAQLNAIAKLNPLISGIPIDNIANPKQATELLLVLKQAAEKLQTELLMADVSTLSELSEWIRGQKYVLNPTKNTLSVDILNRQLSQAPPARDPLERITRSNIARQYLSILLPIIQNTPFEKGAPLGAITILEKNHYGHGLLSQDIFFDTPLFDAGTYTSHTTDAPIPPGIAIVDNPILNEFFIARSLITPSSSLTLGINLFTLALDAFSLKGELLTFIDSNGQLLSAIGQNGNPIPLDFFAHTVFKELLKSSFGDVTIAGSSYHYFRLGDLLNLPIHMLVFVPSHERPEYNMEAIFNEKMTTIYDHLSYQLLLVSLSLLGVALIILSFISRRITKPITMLARAAEDVAAGHFLDVVLPAEPKERAHEKDEIIMLTNSFSNMLQGLKDKEKIRGLLDKVVSKEIASEILAGHVHTGGESKIVTVLFSDIRGFTHRTEHLDPQTVLINLNGYMTAMSHIIETEGGVIDKYVGDEIMALYGAPVELKDGALKAIKTAILMMQKLRTWDIEKMKSGQIPIPIEIGIGIHTGPVVAGNMGADDRLNYTVLGANVNLASRLCAAAAPMQIIVTKETLEASHAKDLLDYEELSPQLFKGFSEPITTYWIKGFK